MRTLPPDPRPGEKVSATLVREIIRAIRERTILPSPGVRTSVGPNGTRLSIDTAKSVAAAAAQGVRGCFSIQAKEVTVTENQVKQTETHRHLVDCWYNVGGVTRHAEDIDIEDLIPVPAASAQSGDGQDEDEEEVDTVIYFKINSNNSTEAGACLTTALQAEQNDATAYVFPLYLFGPDGSLKLDMRNAPQIQQWESL